MQSKLHMIAINVPSDVINQKSSSCSSDQTEVENTYSIPNLKLNGSAINGDHTSTEFHSDSQVMNRLKPLVGELQQQARLSYTCKRANATTGNCLGFLHDHDQGNDWRKEIPVSPMIMYLKSDYTTRNNLNSLMNILKPTLKTFKWNPTLKLTRIFTTQNKIPPKTPQSSTKLTGKIKHKVLTKQSRTKFDINPDKNFYTHPRFTTHVDNNFITTSGESKPKSYVVHYISGSSDPPSLLINSPLITTLTDLYTKKINPEFQILDLMSSWVSHLPDNVKYKKVIGHGLNAIELAKNPRLDSYPEKVFAEVFRLLKPRGVFIVSFSNRMFYKNAIGAWRDGSEDSRVQLVIRYFECVDGFTEPEVVRKVKQDGSVFGWVKWVFGLELGSDPFYCVIAYKNFKPEPPKYLEGTI
ncbi:hypothetical protein LXL04_006085 [Taraxacum kok-saghyz]